MEGKDEPARAFPYVSIASPMTEFLPRIDLKSAVLGRDAAFRTWRAALPQYDITLAGDPDDFRMDVSAWLLPRMVFTHGRTSAVRLERPAERVNDGYDNTIFVMFMKGCWRGVADGRPFTLREGEVCLLDGARPFRGDATASSYAMINVPRATLAELVSDASELHGRVLRTASGWILADHLAALARCLPSMHPREAERMANSTLTLMAACVANVLADKPGSAGGLAPAVRLRVERHIERHLGSKDLTPTALSRELDIPRSTLYRAFASSGGIAATIQSRRLDAGRALLFHPEKRLSPSEIARLVGFGNVTSFTKSFQRRFGCTPTQARRNGSTFIATSDVLFERWQAVIRASS